MTKTYKFGRRFQKQNWKQEEIDQDWENKKALMIFGGLGFFFILMVFFMWWMRYKWH